MQPIVVRNRFLSPADLSGAERTPVTAHLKSTIAIANFVNNFDSTMRKLFS